MTELHTFSHKVSHYYYYANMPWNLVSDIQGKSYKLMNQ